MLAKKERIELMNNLVLAIHDIDCGDFLRGVLFEIGQDSNHNTNTIKENTFAFLQWKFECISCKRYITMQLKDYVIKISVIDEKPLDALLDEFFKTKRCRCGAKNDVEPEVKMSGSYLFLEIDRTIAISKFQVLIFYLIGI